MTDRKQDERNVLDPAWEDDLRRGQEAEGDAGSVESELAVVHLLRHARQPEGIDDARLDAVWGRVRGQVAPVAWWRRPWMIWAPVAAAAAVTIFIIVRPPGEVDEVAVAAEPAQAESALPASESAPASDGALSREASSATAPTGTAAGQGNAALLERQFALLEPKARAEIGADIESQRGSLRYGLLDSAKGGGK